MVGVVMGLGCPWAGVTWHPWSGFLASLPFLGHLPVWLVATEVSTEPKALPDLLGLRQGFK